VARLHADVGRDVVPRENGSVTQLVVNERFTQAPDILTKALVVGLLRLTTNLARVCHIRALYKGHERLTFHIEGKGTNLNVVLVDVRADRCPECPEAAFVGVTE